MTELTGTMKKIVRHIKESGRACTVREISQGSGLTSNQGRDNLKKMKKMGVVVIAEKRYPRETLRINLSPNFIESEEEEIDIEKLAFNSPWV